MPELRREFRMQLNCGRGGSWRRPGRNAGAFSQSPITAVRFQAVSIEMIITGTAQSGTTRTGAVESLLGLSARNVIKHSLGQ